MPKDPDIEGKSDVRVIALTGGPCAGKTTLLERLKELDEISGYKLVFVPEAATMLLTNGYSVADGNERFQHAIFKTQTAWEDMARAYAEDLGGKVAIICDRGLLDNAAFCDDDDMFERVAGTYGLDWENILDRYDMILHMRSVAYGAKELFEQDSNNNARWHDADQSEAAEIEIRRSWCHHPNRHLVEHVDDLDEKLDWCLAKIEEELRGR